MSLARPGQIEVSELLVSASTAPYVSLMTTDMNSIWALLIKLRHSERHLKANGASEVLALKLAEVNYVSKQTCTSGLLYNRDA